MKDQVEKIDNIHVLTWLIFEGPVTNNTRRKFVTLLIRVCHE